MSEGSSAGTSNGVQEDSDEMSVYKKEACKVVTFRIVYDKGLQSDYDAVSFTPEMAHQVFGDSESIFGYKHIAITINMTHNTSQCFLDVEASGRIQRAFSQPDDVVKALNPWMPTNYTKSSSDFERILDNEPHDKMFGQVVTSFTEDSPMKRFPSHQVRTTFRITKTDTSSEELRNFHARFETYIVWFIDAANFIDLDDDRWIIFYVYEEFVHPVNKKMYRTPVAYCTVYKFFSFPNNVRARISQFFVLPSHQRRGIGTTLYQTVVSTLKGMKEVVDITVEEPTREFQRIRDLEDCCSVHGVLVKNKLNYFGMQSKQILDLGRENKIGKKQAQRVYDILGLYYGALKGPEQHKKVLESIKSRISENNMKDLRPGKRFCRIDGTATTLQAAKKDEIENEFKRYCNDIKPSVDYLKQKLMDRLQVKKK